MSDTEMELITRIEHRLDRIEGGYQELVQLTLAQLAEIQERCRQRSKIHEGRATVYAAWIGAVGIVLVPIIVAIISAVT